MLYAKAPINDASSHVVAGDSSFHFAKALTSSTMLAGNADVVYVVAGVLYFKIITVNLIIGNNYIFKVN